MIPNICLEHFCAFQVDYHIIATEFNIVKNFSRSSIEYQYQSVTDIMNYFDIVHFLYEC